MATKTFKTWTTLFSVVTILLVFSSDATAQYGFVNWESPHVSPVDLTPDGNLLLVVNTADNQLEVISTQTREVVDSIPVGLDPVSVRARNNNKAWVVNHVSDSISIVNLSRGTVVRTLYPGDEPADVVFAGNPERAFVSVSQENKIAVFDPARPNMAPTFIQIKGEDPRALGTDGQTVYAAIFESGNQTTSLNEFIVSFPPYNPYPGSPNPVPNSGNGFSPQMNPDLPEPPAAGIIVKKNAQGQWLDDNDGDWTNAVSYDVHDHDVATIDADSLAVSYTKSLMNANMALGVAPTGEVLVVGTNAINEVRFEPNLQGIFVVTTAAALDIGGEVLDIWDLNPHLDYTVPRIPMSERKQSIGDPRGVAWSVDGTQAFVTGMGSNNLTVLGNGLKRSGQAPVGQGPTGVRADQNSIYVLNRFDATVSVLDIETLEEKSLVELHDATPEVIKKGRPFLFNTHLTSGLGQASCASCHIDTGTDRLAWDLGDPSGEMKIFNQIKVDFPGTDVEDWHPMKGPLATQTLKGLADTSPFHWRGDRDGLSEFNPAFVNLQGADAQLSDQQMALLESYVMTITMPPNPFRRVNGSLPNSFPNGGNPIRGRTLFNTGQLDAPFNCVDCHSGSAGTDRRITPQVLDQQTQSMKATQLRGLYEKVGRDDTSLDNNSGYGFVHDGSFDTLFNFLGFGFDFQNDQQKLDVEAYLMNFGMDTHPAVGTQATVPNVTPGRRASSSQLVAFSNQGKIDLIAKIKINNRIKGYVHIGGRTFQADVESQTIELQDLLDLASPQFPVTFTAVPSGTGYRIGIDRDSDGYFDGNEIIKGTDPADPTDFPRVMVESFRVRRGTLKSGSPPDLYLSDDEHVEVAPNRQKLRIVTMEGKADENQPETLSFTIETNHDFGTDSQRVQMFDWPARKFVEVDARDLTGQNTVTEVTVTDRPSRFINASSKRMIARLIWRNQNGDAVIRIDQAFWK